MMFLRILREETFFANGLIEDEAFWIQILNDRNVTFYLWSNEAADKIYERIITSYTDIFKKLYKKNNVKKWQPVPQSVRLPFFLFISRFITRFEPLFSFHSVLPGLHLPCHQYTAYRQWRLRQ